MELDTLLEMNVSEITSAEQVEEISEEAINWIVRLEELIRKYGRDCVIAIRGGDLSYEEAVGRLTQLIYDLCDYMTDTPELEGCISVYTHDGVNGLVLKAMRDTGFGHDDAMKVIGALAKVCCEMDNAAAEEYADRTLTW